ncbi:MAG TPA: hypothetical protein VFW52_03165 [Candidatus Saccharimonadales bacterium]|nr:hypothetical protein [Candidatus Saccharimonadales bacterium]
MDQERKTTGGRNRDKYTLAAIAAAGLIGVVAGGNRFGESPRPHINKAAATELAPLSVSEQLHTFKNRMESLDNKKDAKEVTKLADDSVEYFTASIAWKDTGGKTVFDQLVLVSSHGASTPDRVLLIFGADKPAYLPGTKQKSWLEMDKLTREEFGVIGFDSSEENRISTQVEDFMYKAEVLLEQIEDRYFGPKPKA